MHPTLLDPHVLADRWNIEPETLSQWRWQGRGPKFIKIGRSILYRITDVEAYEDQQCRSSTSDVPDPNPPKKGA